MATEDRTRHDRLRGVLPRVYATDPRESVLGALLEAFADGLREFDRVTDRALRDKWLATAEAQRAAVDITPPEGADVDPWLAVELAGEPKPLEHLGSLLDLLRQPWEIDQDAYRRRLAVLAPLMTRGLATVRALLSFTITTLGAEPCAQLERNGDSTTAFGLEPGRRARCRTCRGGRSEPSGPCPLRAEATIRASLVDNPHRAARLQRAPLTMQADGTAVVRFTSQSLFADRPALELSVREDAIGTPFMASFRSRQTGERIIVNHLLEPGDTLSIPPQDSHDPSQPPRLQQWVDRPAGYKPLPPVVRINGQSRDDVTVTVFRSVTFEGARFDIDHFSPASGESSFDQGTFDTTTFDTAEAAAVEQVQTPAVVPGANTWDYIPLDANGDAVAMETGHGPATLRLRWWTRPAARFLIRIPITPAVRRAMDRGAADHVRRMIHRVRPVGVTPIVDFLEPPLREVLDPGDTPVGLGLAVSEPLSPRVESFAAAEIPAEVVPAVFDATLFDASLLQP